jgi:predicted nucleic acid-binding Zn ribbon protein
VPFDQAYCSEKCYYDDQAKTKKEKRDNMLFVLLSAVSVAIILIAGVLLR